MHNASIYTSDPNLPYLWKEWKDPNTYTHNIQFKYDVVTVKFVATLRLEWVGGEEQYEYVPDERFSWEEPQISCDGEFDYNKVSTCVFIATSSYKSKDKDYPHQWMATFVNEYNSDLILLD